MGSWHSTARLTAISLVVVACGGASTGTVPGTTAPEGAATVTTETPPPELANVEPATPPDVDLSVHDVPLDEIYFDTFDGGSVRLSDSTTELRSSLLDAIPPIDRPVYGDSAAGDWMEPGDLVVGYEAGAEAYAYPFKILNFHEIVNDRLGGVPVLISYCPLCRSAVVYDRRVGDDVLSFGNTSALYESDLVMVDRMTGSYWWQVAGRAIVGPLTGTALQPLPSVVTTWSDWVVQHPDTRVLTRDTGYSRPYERDAFASYADFLDAGQFAFPVSEASEDGRLPTAALVVGVVVGDVARAYPVGDLTSPINDVVADEAIVIFPLDGGAAVFSAINDGVTLVFELRGDDLVDSGTGSIWDSTGAAVSGELTGGQLEAVPSRTTFWFALVGAFPEVEVYVG